MRSYYATYTYTRGVNTRSTGIDDARAICDEINKRLGDTGCTTEEDVLAEIERLDADVVALYGIHAESVEHIDE